MAELALLRTVKLRALLFFFAVQGVHLAAVSGFCGYIICVRLILIQ
jgi:hypothetical protein